MSVRPAVFLDRDGVLNASVVVEGKPYPPRSVDDVVILPRVREAIAALRDAGFLTVVVTNQPDIARGTTPASVVDAINRHLADALGFDDVVVCAHDDADGCACRKPLPGMLVDAARRHGIDLARSWMVGDRWRDIEAGRAAGVATVLVDRNYDERRADAPDIVVGELADAVPMILEQMARPMKG